MKIVMGPHKNWFGPYQLAELLCFWAKDNKDELGFLGKPDWVHHFGEWLAYGSVKSEPEIGEVYSFTETRKTTKLYDLLMWIESKRKRKIKIQIDPWDTWNMDTTLAMIIAPMLKQLKENQHGGPFTDDEDVPEHLRSTAAAELSQEDKDTGNVDEFHFDRWNWILDEMIFAFESTVDTSWEDKFRTGKIDFAFKKMENGMSEMVRGPNDTSETDWEGMKEYEKRIANGHRLFGKYYRGLWD